jgi:hypothetical protein
MITILRVYRPDGEVRAVWGRENAPLLRNAQAMPQRASRVEVVEEGRHRGRFYVDFSPLAVVTGRPEYQTCLIATFDSHEEAVAAEVDWLRRNWLCSAD